jgi:hypothetical protein
MNDAEMGKEGLEMGKEGLKLGAQSLAITAAYLPAYIARSIGILLLGIAGILLVCHFIGWV